MKKNLLINVNGRDFFNFFEPIIYDLSICGRWNIHLLIDNYFSSINLLPRLNKICSEKIIESFYISPNMNANNNIFSLYNNHKSIHNDLKKIINLNITYYLTSSGITTFDKYITSQLEKNVKIIILGKYVRYYFERKETEVQKILYENYNISFNNNKNNNIIKIIEKNNFYKFIHKLRKKKLKDYFNYFNDVILNKFKKFYNKFYKKLFSLLDRKILPYFFLGKIIITSELDKLSQIESNFDLLIVFDKYEELVFKKILKNKKIILAKYPSNMNCFCDKIDNINKPVLSPVSVFGESDVLSDYYSKVLLRDILNSLKELKTNEIHFKHHPDFKSKWIYDFVHLLEKNNIKTKFISSNLSYEKIICNYKAFIGLTSESMKDARANCQNCIIVSFEAASQFRYNQPKFVFGKSEGIEWVDVNGNYKKDIFNKKKHKYSAKYSISEILNNYVLNSAG